MKNYRFYTKNVNTIQPGSIIQRKRGLFFSYFLIQAKEKNKFIGYEIKDIKRNEFTYTFDHHHRVDLSFLSEFPITDLNYNIYELDKSEIRNLNAVIYNIQMKYDVSIKKIQISGFTFYLNGDIITKKDKYYFVHQIINNKVICFEAKKENGFINIPIKNEIYSLSLDEQHIFSFTDNSYKVVFHCKEELIEEIKFYIHKQYHSIQEGSIFNRNNQLYYTYQITENMATCFRMYLMDIHKGNELFKEELIYQDETYYILINEPIEINIKDLNSLYLYNSFIRKEIDLQIKKTRPNVQIGSILQYSKSSAYIIYKIDEDSYYGFEIKQNKMNPKYKVKINKNISAYLIRTIDQLNFIFILLFYYYKLIHKNSNHDDSYYFNCDELKNYAMDFYENNNASCKKNRQLLFDNLIEGDVILAQQSKENNINRPYLVMKIFKNSVLAFPISLKNNKTKFLSYYFLSNRNYPSISSCYVHLSKCIFIHKNQMNKIWFDLNDYDWHNIERRIVASKITGYSDIITSHIENILVEVGDIYLFENELWYAYKIENDIVTSFKVKLDNFDDAIIAQDDQFYYIDKSKKSMIPLQLASSIISILPRNKIDQINERLVK